MEAEPHGPCWRLSLTWTWKKRRLGCRSASCHCLLAPRRAAEADGMAWQSTLHGQAARRPEEDEWTTGASEDREGCEGCKGCKGYARQARRLSSPNYECSPLPSRHLAVWPSSRLARQTYTPVTPRPGGAAKRR